MRRTLRIAFYWVPPLLWIGLITWLGNLSGPSSGWLDFPHSDKWIHGLFFGVLAFLLFRAFRGERKWRPVRAAAIAFLATAGYGGFDEFRQQFDPNRKADWQDWAADVTGASIALVPSAWLASRRKKDSSDG